MNEQVFELAEQALEETHRVMGESCLQEAFDDFYTEKFAKLIIRRCVDIGERYADGNYEVANQILKHFGMED